MDEARRAALRDTLLQGDAAEAPAHELSRATIDAACNRLGVAKEDRWTFEQADANLAQDVGDDGKTAYVIDLKEANVNDQRGLDILKQLRAAQSTGVAFILTHEASTGVEGAPDSEAAIERKLTHDIGGVVGLAPPITVVSKGRLTENNADLEMALAIALKRAGLRRALHQVLTADGTSGLRRSPTAKDLSTTRLIAGFLR